MGVAGDAAPIVAAAGHGRTHTAGPVAATVTDGFVAHAARLACR